MRHIQKSPQEPDELCEYRLSDDPNRSYDNFTRKDVLRQQLLADQGQLCCYCMRRISPGDMKIEHYLCQANQPLLQLHWNNLLGACMGGEGLPPRCQTCDTRKGDDDIQRDPLHAEHMAAIRYLVDGRIQHGDGKGPFQTDIDTTLNLNNDSLCEQRKQALTGLRQALEKKLGAKQLWTRSKLVKTLEGLRSRGSLVPFTGLLEYWLEKAIARR